MITTTVHLTEQESVHLRTIAQETGRTQDDLLQEAVRLLIARFQTTRQQKVLRQLKKKKRYRTEAEKQAARDRFERHFGTLKADDVTYLDNERIDADLAREYANEFEDK